MLKVNKRLMDTNQIFKDRYQEIYIDFYFAKKVTKNGYDEFENNLSDEIISMQTINQAYSREITAERLVYKQYGLKELGALEILCDARYTDYFKLASKIVINSEEYEVFSNGLGDKSLIQKIPFNMIKVTITKKGKI